jgi:hypothetical protein
MSGPGVIAQQGDEVCEMCGKVDECRPYGPNDENICFDCGMKDPATTEKKMGQYIFGEPK